jgi:hypothetical protein
MLHFLTGAYCWHDLYFFVERNKGLNQMTNIFAARPEFFYFFSLQKLVPLRVYREKCSTFINMHQSENSCTGCTE